MNEGMKLKTEGKTSSIGPLYDAGAVSGWNAGFNQGWAACLTAVGERSMQAFQIRDIKEIRSRLENLARLIDSARREIARL